MSGTKGPWVASPFSSIVGSAITAQPDQRKNSVLVATTFNKFDADLIAAAPDLLAALVDLLECDLTIIGPDAVECVSAARLAVVKAGHR